MGVKSVNKYSGDYWEVFVPTGILTKTDTIPIWLQLLDEETGLPECDIAGHKLVLSFASSLSCLNSGDLLLEVEISPQAPTTDAIFSGTVTDDQTATLPIGTVYVSLDHINAAGEKYIYDMAQITVAQCVSNRRS